MNIAIVEDSYINLDSITHIEVGSFYRSKAAGAPSKGIMIHFMGGESKPYFDQSAAKLLMIFDKMVSGIRRPPHARSHK